MTDPAVNPKGSKVLGVFSTDAHRYTPGIKRVGGPLVDLEGGKVSKAPRYTVTDLLPEDEQGRLKWRGDPALTFSDWTIEVVYEGPVSVGGPAPAPETTTSDTTPTKASGAAEEDPSLISPEPTAGGTATPATAATAGTTPGTTTEGGGGGGKDEQQQEVVEIQTQVDTYHVHRYFLAYGTRRSEYFAKKFAEGGASSHKTRFELEPLAAKAFPDLLDFLYDPTMPLVIETSTATALLYLGNQFEMEHLQHYAKEFCSKDLSLETLEHYYDHAKIFDTPVIRELIIDFLARNITALHLDSPIIKQSNYMTDVSIWLSALDKIAYHPTNFVTDLHLSRIIATWGNANRTLLTLETFRDLTRADKIRKVDPSVAFLLCELEDSLLQETASLEDDTGAGTSSLQQRCATALAGNWKELDPVNDPKISGRNATFLVDLLGKCLQEAKAENEKLLSRAGNRAPRGSSAHTSSEARSASHHHHRGDRVTSTERRGGRSSRGT